MQILSICCSSPNVLILGGLLLLLLLGFVPFKKNESVLDIQQELDKICKYIKPNIWSTSI